MKHYLLPLAGGVCLLLLTLAAVTDNTGTTRFRQGAVLSFDPQVTIKDEDGAWSGNPASFFKNAQLWTNDTLVVRPLSHIPILAGDASQAANANSTEGLFIWATNASDRYASQMYKDVTGITSSRAETFFAHLQGIPTNANGALFSAAMEGGNFAGGITASGSTYFGGGAIGVEGTAGASSLGGASFGLFGYASGLDNLLVGMAAEADAAASGATNVGLVANFIKESQTGVFVAAYVEGRNSALADGTDDPVMENAILLADCRETGIPIFIARTNNGTHVASLSAGGEWTANGYLAHSNVLASIPTLAKGDVYLWSSNGIGYLICSSPSGTLTTNKLAP